MASGPELADVALAGMATGGEQFENLVAVIDRRRHQVGCLAAGIAEHDALVARTFLALPVGSIVDALADVWRLSVEQDLDLGGLPVKAVLFVADVADCLAGGRFEFRRVDDRMAGRVHQNVAGLVLLEQRLRHADFAGDHDAVGCRQRFACDADLPWVHSGLLGFAVDEIDNFV